MKGNGKEHRAAVIIIKEKAVSFWQQADGLKIYQEEGGKA